MKKHPLKVIHERQDTVNECIRDFFRQDGLKLIDDRTLRLLVAATEKGARSKIIGKFTKILDDAVYYLPEPEFQSFLDGLHEALFVEIKKLSLH